MDRPDLIRNGGAMVIGGLITGQWFEALRAEGLASRSNATESQSEGGGGRQSARGNPGRYLASAGSGPVLDTIYADPGLGARLSGLAGMALHPTGGRGSYSYYDRPGHYLGLHRDIRSCDLTLITCLARTDGAQPSGALRLYPQAMGQPLDSIGEQTPHRDIEMQPGDSVLLLGGCIPHEVLPAAPGFTRAIAVLCYEVAR